MHIYLPVPCQNFCILSFVVSCYFFAKFFPSTVLLCFIPFAPGEATCVASLITSSLIPFSNPFGLVPLYFFAYFPTVFLGTFAFLEYFFPSSLLYCLHFFLISLLPLLYNLLLGFFLVFFAYSPFPLLPFRHAFVHCTLRLFIHTFYPSCSLPLLRTASPSYLLLLFRTFLCSLLLFFTCILLYFLAAVFAYFLPSSWVPSLPTFFPNWALLLCHTFLPSSVLPFLHTVLIIF